MDNKLEPLGYQSHPVTILTKHLKSQETQNNRGGISIYLFSVIVQGTNTSFFNDLYKRAGQDFIVYIINLDLWEHFRGDSFFVPSGIFAN